MEVLAKLAVPYKDCDYDVQVYSQFSLSLLSFVGIYATLEVSAQKMNQWTAIKAKEAEEAKIKKEQEKVKN
jgi:hypothetical protein